MAGVFVSLVFDAVRDLDRGQLCTLLALADNANQSHNGRTWPSLATIAQRAACSERQVRYDLRIIEQKSWVVRVSTGEGGRGRATTYELRIDRMLEQLTEDKQKIYRRMMAQKPGNELPRIVKNTRQSTSLNPEAHFNKPGNGLHKTRQPIAPEPEVTGIEPERTSPAPAIPPPDFVKAAIGKISRKVTDPERPQQRTREEQLAYVREQTHLDQTRKR